MLCLQVFALQVIHARNCYPKTRKGGKNEDGKQLPSFLASSLRSLQLLGHKTDSTSMHLVEVHSLDFEARNRSLFPGFVP